jgi:trimethylamine--corrinoid protein Co-methyltransferase
MIESGMTFDYGQMVMDAEFVRMIKFAVGGVPVNDDTLSVDIIKEVGPFKDFLAHENTYKHMRMYPQPKMMDRRMREDWEADGSLDMHTKATAYARHILENHQPDPLSEHVQSELRTIVEEAEKELGLDGK